MRRLLRILWIALIWAVTWGLTGAAAGAVLTVFHPDTGHIPADKIPVFIGVPSAVFGLVAGLLYGLIAVGLGIEASLGSKGRTLIGAGVGCAAGLVYMRIFAHHYLTVLLAAIVGALLAIAIFRATSAQRKGVT